MTPDEIRDLQMTLILNGYLSEYNARGRHNADGVMGQVTRAAYAHYLADQKLSVPIVLPAPAKPWWQSRRGQGLIKMGVGLAVGIVGNFWEPASHVDSTLLLDTIFATMPTILEALGIGIGAYGATESAVGAAKARAPLTLRRPDPAPAPRDRLRDPPLPARAASSRQPVRTKGRDARGHFSDDY